VRMVEPLAELRGDPLSSCSLALGMPAVNAHTAYHASLGHLQRRITSLVDAVLSRAATAVHARPIQESAQLALQASLDDAGMPCSTWTGVVALALAAARNAIGTRCPVTVVICIATCAAVAVAPPHTCRQPAKASEVVTHRYCPQHAVKVQQCDCDVAIGIEWKSCDAERNPPLVWACSLA
jgi:hypothetical protein